VSQDYDPTVKALVEFDPASWLPFAGQRPAPVTVIDADVSAVLSGAADKFLRVHADPEYVLHLDFQSGHDSAQLAPRLRLYNAVADSRTGLPVRSVAVVLRPEADSPQLTGRLARRVPGERPYAIFRYGVIRVWQLSAEQLLAGGLGTLPLAPISALNESEVPGVVRRMKQRLRREERASELWTATEVLLGLRYPPDLVDIFLRGVQGMRESSTYQRIVDEGRTEGRAEGLVEGARDMLLLVGEEHLGPADAATRAAIEAIHDTDRLQELGKGVFKAKNWQELLASTPRRRRNGRRKSGR
jgi:predicted transposase YdaD